MFRRNFNLIATLCVFLSKLSCSILESTCKDGSGSDKMFKMSVDSKVNLIGEWITTISAEVDSIILSKNMSFDVIHRNTECNGRQIIYIQGVSKDKSVEVADDRLYFHQKCGKNIAIIGDGRTVQKINLDDPHNSVAFTNRPLKSDEVFEVRLDKKNTKFSHSLGIGITTQSPIDIEIPPQMYRTPIAWIMHNDHVYTNASVLVKNYGRNLNELQVGDRVGVMRSRFATLHYFVNGVDQGPAASNIPETIYGVFELWNNAAKATIVDTTSSSSK